MRRKVFTNESFDRYIYKLSSRRRFENRWDSLDLDDAAADINIPSQSEVDAAVRELDFVDDVATKTGAGDIKIGDDGRIQLLDFDDDGKQVHKDDDSGPVRDLDYDDKGKDVAKSKSNVGALGALDYDDDVDTSGIAASIDDVYTALASDDARTIKAIIKRYAGDIKDDEKIKEAMLAQAMKLNLDGLRVLCGDMKVTLTGKEKKLDFIDRDEINNVLKRLKNIASKLTGANNTYGLIPNAIVQCTPEDQIKCMNVIDFLKEWVNLPIIPMYFRGAVIKKCYDLAEYLYNELPEGSISRGLLVGQRGLLTRTKGQELPDKIINLIADAVVKGKMSSQIIGDVLIMALRGNNNEAYNIIRNGIDFGTNKGSMIIDYVDDNDAAAFEILKKRLKL